MPLPASPGPQCQNKTAQEGNGASTILTEVLDNEMLTMAITVLADLIIVAPAIKPPAVAPFSLQIGLPPPLTSPLTPPYPPHVPLPPPLQPKHLPLIVPPPSPSNLVSDKEDVLVVEFHQNKWK